MSIVRLVLYRRPGCHLCDDAERLLDAEARALGVMLDLRRVDIDSDPALLARFMLEIPVVALPAGTPELRAPFGAREVRALLTRIQAAAPAAPE